VGHVTEGDLREWIAASQAQGTADEGRARELEDRSRCLAEQIGYNLRAARAGAVDLETLAAENAPLVAEKRGIDAHIDALTQQREDVLDAWGLAGLEMEAARRSLDAWSDADRRNLLLRIVDHVELLARDASGARTLTIHWTIPDAAPTTVVLPRHYRPAT
jgi:hypothetical protein